MMETGIYFSEVGISEILLTQATRIPLVSYNLCLFSCVWCEILSLTSRQDRS